MTHELIPTHETVTIHDETERPEPRPVVRWALVGGAVVLALGAGLAAGLALSADDDVAGATADINAQGGEGPAHGADEARLERRLDGLVASIDTAAPGAGTYDYPTADMIPPDAPPHPDVVPGEEGAPETFTLWMFVFNDPELCTDSCDIDDIGTDTPAQGGVYQVDGRIADGERLVMTGSVRIGQPAANGAPLQRPTSAEVHLAIAPHGRALSGDDLWRQLNGPVGDPTLWWAATFAP